MKTKYILIALWMLSAFTTTAFAQFYDSKAYIAGLSGSYGELIGNSRFSERLHGSEFGTVGYEGKFFHNPIGIKDPHLTKGNGKKIKYDMAAMTERLNKEQAGKRVLDYLFMRDAEGKMSEERLKQRAIKNIQLNDVERAKVGVIDPNTILQEDYLGVLLNNYIVFTERILNRTHWAVFHVDIDKKTLDDVFAAWDDPTRYNAIRVNVTPVASGNTKDKNPGVFETILLISTYSLKAHDVRVNAVQRAIGKAVPELAIRGQIYQSHPMMADVGGEQGIRNADRLYVYRQSQDKNGQFHSKKIAEVRAASVTDNTISLHTIRGLQPSYKKGDIARLHTDRGVRNTFTYDTGNKFQGYTYTFDYLTSVTSYGLGRHALVSFGYSHLEDGKKSLFQFRKTLAEAPTFIRIGIGQGREFTLLNNIQVMPYVMICGEQIKMKEHATTEYGTDKDWQHVHYPLILGARASLKIIGPLEVTGGISYTMKLYDPKDNGSNDFKLNELEEYVFDPMGAKRFGLQMNMGVSLAF